MQPSTYQPRFTKSVLFLIVFIGSCVNHDLEDLPCPTPISYSTVNALFTTKCAVAGCHNGSLGDHRNWTEYEDVSTYKVKIREKVVAGEMPPPGSATAPLSAEQIEQISCWVLQGAKNE